MRFSVLMSVYKNEKVEFFRQAMDSVLNQTVLPDEIILIRDGEVYAELQTAIDEYINNYPNLFTYIPLENNGGLGNALRLGVEKSRNELIARMDTDDVCVADRFEKQLQYFEKYPETDIVGGNIAEFAQSPEIILDYRIVPDKKEDIITLLKKRSPLNHVTVMFKQSSVVKAGNYQDFYLFEDWYLWIRMYLDGCIFGNINENLCNVRVLNMAKRRGGMKYYKSCKKLLRFMKENKVIGAMAYYKACFVRFCGYVLCPNGLRAWCYKKFLRKKKNG